MDLLTRKIYPKAELFRLVKQDGKLCYDKKGDLPGRGIYLHKDRETLEKVFKKGLLKRYCPKEDLSLLERELTDDVR